MGSVPADLSPDATGPAPPADRRPLLRRRPGASRRGAWAWAAPFLFPTPTSMRRVALAGVVANAGIIMTGAAVRLSASGLGCPDWPDCTSSSLVAARTRGDPMVHTYIEFTNRMLTFALMVVAVLVMVTAWRFRPAGYPAARHRLAGRRPAARRAWPRRCWAGSWCSTDLNPAAVSLHFLLSSAILALAVTLWSALRRG